MTNFKSLKKGILISFEGIEGCGKTTQAKLLAKELSRVGYRVKLTREPGGTAAGEKVRLILLKSKNIKIAPLTELLLYLSSRSQHITEVIREYLREKYIVITDRFHDSSIAYQGFGRKLGEKTVRELNKIATGGLMPHITFVLDCPVSIGLGRTRRRTSKPDRLEREALAFHRRVRHGYLLTAMREKGRIIVINATRPKEKIAETIKKIVKNKFKLRTTR
ncbi:MAG TPA: dTMP kinase [bacterium]